MKDILIFSKRRDLAVKINSYITKNGIAMDTFSVITTLSSLGLLDVEACKTYIDGDKETVTEAGKRFKELHDRMTNGEATAEEIVEYMKLAEEKYK